jgi:DNA-binding NarL/FixJ family response regulator
MSEQVTILIVDDHIVLREGLKALLATHDDWKVVGEANDGFEVMPLFEELSPQLIILDLGMPNLGGVETIRRLKKASESTLVLVLSAKDDQQSVREAMKAGANGYVPKTSQSNELEFAISAVLKGQTYLSPSICDAMLLAPDEAEGGGSPLGALTDREREVMKLLSEGKPNRDVAKALHISPRTVDSHRANIMKKLGVQSNAEIVQMALRHGLVE